MHLDKIANGAESQILQHNGRDLSRHSNSNIKPELSHLNYNLTDQDGRTALQRFNDRLHECSYRKQKNNVRMESIVITAPKNIKAEDISRFFRTAHKELQELTGGKANEVGAFVHLDESQAHLHYCFVPAVEVNGTLKLSAKTLMNRDKLKVMHPSMQAAIDQAFGHHKYIVVADDPADRQQSSDTIQVYKAKQAKVASLNKEIQQTTDSLNLAKEQFDDALTSVMLAAQQQQQMDKDITAAQQKYKALQDKAALLSEQAEKTDLWLTTVNNAVAQKTDEFSDLSEKVDFLSDKIEHLEQYLQDNQYMADCVDIRQFLEQNEPDYLQEVIDYIHNNEYVQQNEHNDWEDELGL